MAKATGKAEISAEESLIPGIRQRVVARAYIEGLERDRQTMVQMEGELNQIIWEAVQLGAYGRAMQRALTQLAIAVTNGDETYELREEIEKLLTAVNPLMASIYECECGHSKYDHDEKGCLFLGCFDICGTTKKRRTK